MTYHVEWSPRWHRGIDFLLPGQASGRRTFRSERAAKTFAQRLRDDGVRVGPHAGQEVFGDELKITLSRSDGKTVGRV
jgi:hypothetical protein